MLPQEAGERKGAVASFELSPIGAQELFLQLSSDVKVRFLASPGPGHSLEDRLNCRMLMVIWRNRRLATFMA
jgi:hypothetical protein